MDKIFVTRPLLPNLSSLESHLIDIWESKWLTNMGSKHNELENKLKDVLKVPNVSLFNNGTIALLVAIKSLDLPYGSEVITTPFTFAATPHCIAWNGLKPVFCDIEPDTFTLDPEKVESLITPQTTAIMPVHVYGNPCQHEKLQKIADTYGLKLFYDAAHVFGVKKDGISICNWGDLSMLSFHATKVFNTFEGGALVTNDPNMKQRIDHLKNFGFSNEVTVIAPGSNGKMDEFRAAFGLMQLERVDNEIAKRKAVAERYRDGLKDIPGIRMLYDIPGVHHNYAYFPILVDTKEYGISRDELYDLLKNHDILSRRYFYPLCSDFPTYKSLPSATAGNLPVSTMVSRSVLCLPMYADLQTEDQDKIISIIKK